MKQLQVNQKQNQVSQKRLRVNQKLNQVNQKQLQVSQKRLRAETKWADIPHIPVEEYGFPMEEAGTLQFTQEEMYLSCDDFRFTEQYDWTALDLGDEEDEVLDELWENFSSSGHQLGGYPYFTQEDPRAYSDDVLKEYELLFQLDTDDTIECMWGDAGVANFFIHPDDLKNRNFSNVLYNWDCH